VSTQINWGASYLTNDLYQRFLRPDASQAELVAFGRAASAFITVLGATAAFYADSVQWIFQLVIAIGTGPGVVLILRWFWWRINAWTELAAMAGGTAIGLLTSLGPVSVEVAVFQSTYCIPVQIEDFGLRLMMITVLTTAIWLPVMLFTRAESLETRTSFYRLVRPGGPGWRVERQMTGLPAAQPLRRSLLQAGAAVLVLYGTMFATGGALLLRPWVALGMGAVASLGGVLLYRLRTRPAPVSP